MKTIEQAALEYAEHEANDFPSGDCRADMNLCEIEDWFKDAFKAGAEFAQRWISVEEELPPLGVPVTCKYNMFGKECYWSGTFYTEERLMHFIKKHLMITHLRLIELN